jgi:MinD-like ATPase involved in chromosome partitioning or flagellar assembly
VSGNEALLDMANVKHGQKEMLFRHIHDLDVDDVLLDLGAGSAFNVLDFFLLARRRLVVTTPEPTAIENAEHFLKAALYRSFKLVTRSHPEVRAVILRLRQERRGWRVRSAGELIALVRAIDPPSAKLLEEGAQAFAPVLLVNQVRTAEQRGVGAELIAAWRDRLGVQVEFAESVDVDPSVSAAVAQRQPAIQASTAVSRELSMRSRRLLRGEEVPVRAEDDLPAPMPPRRSPRCRPWIWPSPAPTSPLPGAAGSQPERDGRADADPRPRPHRERALRAAAVGRAHLRNYLLTARESACRSPRGSRPPTRALRMHRFGEHGSS